MQWGCSRIWGGLLLPQPSLPVSSLFFLPSLPVYPQPPPFKVIVSSPISFKDLAASPGHSGIWLYYGMVLNYDDHETMSVMLRSPWVDCTPCGQRGEMFTSPSP